MKLNTKVRNALAGLAVLAVAVLGFGLPSDAAVPLTATITATPSCVGTSCTITYVVNTNEPGGGYLYAWNPRGNVLFNGVAPGSFGFYSANTDTFVETGIACTETSFEIDVPMTNDGWVTHIDIPVSGTLPGSCSVPPPPTTTTTVPPTTTTVPPVVSSGPVPPSDGSIPAAAPQTSLSPTLPTSQGSLALTGMDLAPLLETGSALLVAGGSILLGIKLRKRVTA